MTDLLSISVGAAAIIVPAGIIWINRKITARNIARRRLESIRNSSVTEMMAQSLRDHVDNRRGFAGDGPIADHRDGSIADHLDDHLGIAIPHRLHPLTVNPPCSPWNPIVESDGHRVLQSEVTSGDPLPAAMIARPNLGGEGNPEYRGPNYVEAREIAEEMKGIRRYAETFREWRERVGKPASRHFGDKA